MLAKQRYDAIIIDMVNKQYLFFVIAAACVNMKQAEMSLSIYINENEYICR